MTDINPDLLLESYDYELPESLIAQRPAPGRDRSRLMRLDKGSGAIGLHEFRELPDILPPGALLVANDSRVLPARLYGAKPSGGRVEFLLLIPLPLLEIKQDASGASRAEAECLLKASKAAKAGDIVVFSDDFSLTVIEVLGFGRCRVELCWRGDLAGLFFRLGHQPLPPYIRRPDTPEDARSYQTIYADQAKTGSVAAPTAGLHFTPEVRDRLRDAGFGWSTVTLYVGYGTFSSVREADITRHAMHAEYVEVPQDTAEAVLRAKSEGRPVIAVGTTTVRALEGTYRALDGLGPFSGWINLFIHPGFRFGVVDHLLTNFHLPGSSLLMMVSALAGRERILAAYKRAVSENFRFYSYGDAMFIF